MAARNSIAAMAVRGWTWEWSLPGAGPVPEGGAFDLPPPEDATDLRAAVAAAGGVLGAALREHGPRLGVPLSLGLPSDAVLLRILDLPLASGDELSEMIALQVDKFSPFNAEDTAAAAEVLHAGESSQRVLVAVLQTSVAENWRRLCQAAGWTLARLDLNLLGWWQGLREAGQIPDLGCQVLLLYDRAACDLLVVRNGMPLAVRSLGNPADVPPDEAASEMARETLFTVAGVLAGEAQESLDVRLWHVGADLPAAFAVRLQERLGAPVHSASLDTLPALAVSLARRAAEPAPPRLDLSPPAWRASARDRLHQHHVVAVGAVIATFWVLVIAVLISGPLWIQRRAAGLQSQLDGLQSAAQATQATRNRVQTLDQYLNRTHSGLEVLREVSRTLPPGIDLRNFAYRKGKQVEMNGEAQAVSLVYDFKKELDASSMFQGVELPRTFHTPKGESFKITASFPGGKKE